MHKSLGRQLRRLGIEPHVAPDGEQWKALLEVLGATYEQSDRERYRLERALRLSSDESRRHADRHQALSLCAQALLMQATATPEKEALVALTGAVELEGAWIVRRDGDSPRVVAIAGDIESPDGLVAEFEELATDTPVHDRPTSRGRELHAPVFVHDRLLGLLGCRMSDDRRRFHNADVELVSTAAAMVAAHWARLETQEALQALVHSKDRFVASISHELRTPLTAVVGFASELEGRWHAFSAAEARDMVDLIVEQSREVAHMVDDLLVAARSDIGKIRLDPQPLDLRQQVNLVAGRISEAPGLRVLPEGHAVGIGDATRVRQIIRNLITNAVRYGGRTVRIRIMSEVDRAVLEVRDNGPGVPDEAVDRIFDAFHSAHESPTQPNSVGLGLWVARTLAELMGGDLSYRREHEETVFSLALPKPV